MQYIIITNIFEGDDFMTITLPKTFEFRENGFEAHIDEHKRLIMSRSGFEKIMYALTYQLKGNKYCYYCGKNLDDEDRTLDHQYPRDFGGISIPNNLVPCCKKCNEEKGNMNEVEYYDYKLVKGDSAKKELFIEELFKKRNIHREQFGVALPYDWFDLQSEYSVLAPITSVDKYKSNKQYIRISDLYETYHRICRPVVITKNGIVVDGFLALMFAKNLPYKVEIPFITLDNVIAI